MTQPDSQRRAMLAALSTLPLAGPSTAPARSVPAVTIGSFATRRTLAAGAGVSGDAALLGERGRTGLFVWTDDNLRAAVRADTLQGLHVAPATDPTGASGAWVRMFDETVDVHWFGAVADGKHDDGPAFNAALATQRSVYAPTGIYRIATPIVAPPVLSEAFTPGLSLHGDGMGRTILEGAFPNAAVISLIGRQGHFHRGVRLAGLTLRPHATVAGSRGVDFLANYTVEVDRLEIRNFQGDGIRFTSLIGDVDGGDATAHVTISNCDIRANAGHGVATVMGPDVNHVVLVDVVHTFIWYNTLGGILTSGHMWRIDQSNLYGNRGRGGLIVTDPGGAPQMISVRRTEFDNNEPQHIFIERVIQFESEDCQFNFSDDASGHGFRPVRLLEASPGGKECLNIRLIRPRFRSTPVNPELSTTLYRLGAGVRGFAVVDPFYQHFQGDNATSYAGLTEVQEERRDGAWQGVRKRIHSATAARYAPDLRDGAYHAVTLKGANRCSIENPLNPADGTELILEILNAVDENLIVAFGADILQSGWSIPAYGYRRTGHFIYRAAMKKWLQIGLWSGELR